jgi:hypothetical protein
MIFLQSRLVATAIGEVSEAAFRAHSNGRAEEAQLMRRIAVLDQQSWIA